MDEVLEKEITNKVDKRTKEYRESVVTHDSESLQQPSEKETVADYTTDGATVEPTKPPKPSYENCSECEEALPGLPEGGRRVQPEACRDCVWKNYKKEI